MPFTAIYALRNALKKHSQPGDKSGCGMQSMPATAKKPDDPLRDGHADQSENDEDQESRH